MNKQTTRLVGVNDNDYRKWCKENKKPIHKTETKQEFFGRIMDGKLAKTKSGKLVKQRKSDNA